MSICRCPVQSLSPLTARNLSVRTIVLPNVAHDVENVTCNEDNGGLITTSIRGGHCKRLAGVKLTEVYLKSEQILGP